MPDQETLEARMQLRQQQLWSTAKANCNCRVVHCGARKMKKSNSGSHCPRAPSARVIPEVKRHDSRVPIAPERLCARVIPKMKFLRPRVPITNPRIN